MGGRGVEPLAGAVVAESHEAEIDTDCSQLTVPRLQIAPPLFLLSSIEQHDASATRRKAYLFLCCSSQNPLIDSRSRPFPRASYLG